MGQPATRAATRAGLLLAAAALAAVPPVASAAPGAPAAPAGPAFQQVTLAKGTAEVGEPMALAVLPDRSVLHTSRDGAIRRTDAAGTTTLVGRLTVYTHDEEGLQAIAVDPGFASNRHVYVYYAPPLTTPDGDAPAQGDAEAFAPWQGVNRLSRFVLTPANTLDVASETRILDVPADRGMCCHVGGDIDFDAAGNLYLSTGDDTNPFASDGYTPIDERPNRNPAFDAQRSAANTNDLRGKLLRIKVNPNGTYTIPPGNLFPPGTPNTRPEIYAMGFRNPFRFTVDKPTGTIHLGDHGPDAAAANPARGPAGQVEFNRITKPGNYGWPYCTGRNEAYTAYDFGTGASGTRFDCAGGARNRSPRNTGAARLPPAVPAWLTYDGGSVRELGNGSESPVGGAVYRHDPRLDSDVAFPKGYDGNVFLAEFGRRWIKRVVTRPGGAIAAIHPFPWSGTQVIDLAFGPDGALYVLDYGTGFGNGDARSALYRIDHVKGGRAPVAVASASPTAGIAPLTVRFSAAGSADPDGDRITLAWDFDGDGDTDATGARPTHTYTADGTFTAILTARDPGGRTATATTTIVVGNTAPRVRLLEPADGQVFRFGEPVRFRVEVSDPEDGAVDCARVRVDHLLGHDHHGHLLSSARGCAGTIRASTDGEHAASANIFGVWTATYTDGGGLTGTAQHRTQPETRQAEHFSDQRGIQLIDHAGAQAGRTVGAVHDGDWIAFAPYDLRGVGSFRVRVSSAGPGGTVELRADSPTGPPVGSATVPVTGAWNSFTEVSGAVTDPGGTRTLYLVFKGAAGPLFDVDQLTFVRAAG